MKRRALLVGLSLVGLLGGDGWWWLSQPRVYFQVMVPDDCVIVWPLALGSFPGGAYLYARPGIREFTFDCSGKRYTIPLKVCNDETYRSADPRKPDPEDLRCR